MSSGSPGKIYTFAGSHRPSIENDTDQSIRLRGVYLGVKYCRHRLIRFVQTLILWGKTGRSIGSSATMSRSDVGATGEAICGTRDTLWAGINAFPSLGIFSYTDFRDLPNLQEWRARSVSSARVV